jgi:hypothetical protein
MTPTELSVVILAIVGAGMQIAFRYAPRFSQWYQSLENKGAYALGFSALAGLAYFGLSCTPYAAQLNIAITCTTDSIFALLQSIFIIASSQQLTYLFTRKSVQSA